MSCNWKFIPSDCLHSVPFPSTHTPKTSTSGNHKSNFFFYECLLFKYNWPTTLFLLLLHSTVCAQSLQSCPTLCDPMDSIPPGSSVYRILQARILEWVAMPSSRESSGSGIKSGSLALQVDSFPLSLWRSPQQSDLIRFKNDHHDESDYDLSSYKDTT